MQYPIVESGSQSKFAQGPSSTFQFSSQIKNSLSIDTSSTSTSTDTGIILMILIIIRCRSRRLAKTIGEHLFEFSQVFREGNGYLKE